MPSAVLYTPDLDPAAASAALKRLAWTPADLARASGLPEGQVRDLLTGRAYRLRDGRRVRDALDAALAARAGR